jgi:hypothetical protein
LQLLLDFEKGYGDLVDKFVERFPILRGRLLDFIAEEKLEDLVQLSKGLEVIYLI